MEYTKFGEEIRVLRARRHQTIKDMVKIDLLCLNEGNCNGRQSVSSKWIIDKTKKIYAMIGNNGETADKRY